MKIRIFALAKELGLDNKTLIDLCAEAGIEVKNSALASITPEQRDRVVAHINGEAAPALEQKQETPAAPAPVREKRSDRVLRDIPAPKQTADATDDGSGDSDDSDVAVAVAEDETETESGSGSDTDSPSEPQSAETPAAGAPADEPDDSEATSEVAAEAESSDESETDTVAETEATTETTESESEKESVAEPVAADESAAQEPATETVKEPVAEADETPEAKTDEDAGDESGDDKPDSDESTPKSKSGSGSGPNSSPSPVRKEDYVSTSGEAGGAGGLRQIPQMVPRGNVSEQKRRSGNRGERKSALPAMAAVPQFTPKPKAKKEEEEAPAQRPDMKLTADMLTRQGPLKDHIRRHGERGKPPGEEEARPGRKPGRSGGGRRDLRTSRDNDRERERRPGGRQKRGPKRQAELKTHATIEPPITVRSLSEAIGRPAKSIQSILFQEGQIATINDSLDEDTALMIALELGVELEFRKARDVEEELTARLDQEDDPESLITRPPVVTILGHVDHGKTSLLDKIRETSVADGEIGGITQHIRAYQVQHGEDGGRVTFVDTPGHAAFSEMRARGANVTDIVVLVVAADDGVMPQTIESIQHVKQAGVPMIVAMNKSDLPDTNEQRVLQELAAQEVLPAEWGGDTEVVRTSAITGDGLGDLLETIQLTAELHEFTANPDRASVGVCLEAFQDEGRGTVAWVIVQKGTLRVGDDLLCGPAYGRVRAMYNDLGQQITEALPSSPVKISGLDVVPRPGDHFFEMTDIEEARETAEERRYRDRTLEISEKGFGSKNLKDFLEGGAGDYKTLPIILKTDTPGSLEALKSELQKFEHPEVKVDIKAAGVGGVNESDVQLANATGAVIIAFQVIPDDRAQEMAEAEGIDIRRFSIIYEITDRIKGELEGLLSPERQEIATGRALVLRTFSYSRTGTIAGCRILSGSIERSHRVHVIRDQKVINTYPIASLRREKEDVKEVRDGMECGIRLDGFNDIKEGDLFEAYRVEEVKRTLD